LLIELPLGLNFETELSQRWFN